MAAEVSYPDAEAVAEVADMIRNGARTGAQGSGSLREDQVKVQSVLDDAICVGQIQKSGSGIKSAGMICLGKSTYS